MCNLAFCTEFGYPQQVRTLIEQAVEAIVEALDPVSVLLFGSASRNEMSYLLNGGQIDLLSDIEMMVITHGRARATAQLSEKIKNIETLAHSRNPLFHIDYGVANIRQIPKVHRTIRVFDIKQYGKTVYGQDLVDLLPVVNEVNLDRGRTRELVLIRLANQLLFIPKRIVLGNPSAYERFIFSYVSARNALDVPTILLALSGTLLGSYTERISHIRREFDAFDWTDLFGGGFVHLLEVALKAKFELVFEIQGWDLYRAALRTYWNLLRYILGTTCSADLSNLCQIITSEGLGMLESRRGKWKAYEAYLALKGMGSSAPLHLFHWLVARKREIGICFLLCMHEALLMYHQERKDEAREYLQAAARLQDKLRLTQASGDREVSDLDFRYTWLDMRSDFVAQLAWLLRMSDRTVEYYYKVLEWRCD